MKRRVPKSSLAVLFGAAGFAMTFSSATAALFSQYGILDLTANGGINPNTGVAWQAGDKYRLAFHTDGTIDGTSDDPSVYDLFATTQAQQNTALASSTGWTAMVWVNTDSSLPQAVDPNNPQAGESPVSSPLVRGGYGDTTGGSGIGGAGVPIFAMDGMTAIARNNADMFNGWSNPFDGDTTVRIPSSMTTSGQNVHYSPFLDQFAAGDTGDVHGANVWTGGFGSAINPLGNSVDPDSQTRGNYGSSNANSSGRTTNRFQSGVTGSLSVYAISPEFTVVPEPSTALLGGLGLLALLRRRRR